MMNPNITQEMIDATREPVNLFGRPYPGAYLQETHDGKFDVFLNGERIANICRKIDGLEAVTNHLIANTEEPK